VQRLSREAAAVYAFATTEPRLIVEPSERFVLETEDALGGRITREDQPPVAGVLGDVLTLDRFNPCTGPVHVRGAEPGDLLAVTIHDIELAPTGVTCVFEGLGPLADSAAYPDCRGPFTKLVAHGEDGTGRCESWTWRLAPHVGTIGVASAAPLAAGADTNYGQGPFGGNLDVRDIAPGSTVLLPVAVAGALLSLGDVHSSMGDGELFGAGVESRAAVTLSCELRQGSLPFPRIETPTHLIQLNSARPLEHAIDEAFRWMLAWLVEDFSVSARDAYVLLGIEPDVRINVYQLVRLGRLNATVGVAFPRAVLER
jgi:acetamidase/formamidase